VKRSGYRDPVAQAACVEMKPAVKLQRLPGLCAKPVPRDAREVCFDGPIFEQGLLGSVRPPSRLSDLFPQSDDVHFPTAKA
jgi:hypothetical protein